MNTTNKRDGLNELTNKLRQMNSKLIITTTKQDETLVYAAKSFAENLHNDNAGNYKLHDKDCFIAGANWQKEQDKVIIDKLIEALKDTCFCMETYKSTFIDIIQSEVYSRAKQLLNSLK